MRMFEILNLIGAGNLEQGSSSDSSKKEEIDPNRRRKGIFNTAYLTKLVSKITPEKQKQKYMYEDVEQMKLTDALDSSISRDDSGG